MTDNIFSENGGEGGATTNTDRQEGSDNQTGQHTQTGQQGGDNPLDALVGEGRKYKTVDDLVRAVHEKDRFIEQLKEEQKGARETLAEYEERMRQSKTIDDVLDRIGDTQKGGGNQSLTSEDIKKIATEAYAEYQSNEEKRKNHTESQQRVLEYFGGDREKSMAFIAEKAKELNLSRERIEGIASQSPEAFAKLMGLGERKRSPSPTVDGRGGEETSAALNMGKPKEGTKAYWDMKRKELGDRKFFDPKVQQQIFKDRKRLGDDFYN